MFDCDHVLHSRWSTVLSIPVSVLAVATHMLVLATLFAKPRSEGMKRIRRCTLGFASLTAGVAAVWFCGLQVFVLQRLCPYCLVAHASGIMLAIIFVRSNIVGTNDLQWIAGGAAVSLAGLITLQSISVVPETHEVIDHTQIRSESDASVTEEATLFEAPESMTLPQKSSMLNNSKNHFTSAISVLVVAGNPLTLFLGAVGANAEERHARTARVLDTVELDITAWPLLGEKNAEIVFVELFDYTCPHCKKTHSAIEGARQKFGDRLAVIALPVPLDVKCNSTVKSTQAMHAESCDIAKLAIAVWVVDRSKFAEFHHFLFTSNASYAQAILKAKTLVDETSLNQTLSGPIPKDFIAKHVSLYQKAGAGTIPKLMFPKTTIVGAIETPDAMIRLIEKHSP